MGFFQSHLNVECIPEIKRVRPQAHDNIMLCDVPGLIERMEQSVSGADSFIQNYYRDHLEKMRRGDLSKVPLSDKYLCDLEDDVFLSKAWHNETGVIGALPNIPAYLAGVPTNMRNRVRAKKPQGPLSIFLECTGSGSTMREHALGRGAAMLALVRALSDQRPVDLWLCVTYGTTNEMNGMLCRIETMPLDLGRAAHMLCSLPTTASIGGDIIAQVIGHNPGSWSYGVPELERKWCGEIFKRFLHPYSEVLYVPAALTGDGGLGDARVWLRNMLVKYGGESVVRRDDDMDHADSAYAQLATGE